MKSHYDTNHRPSRLARVSALLLTAGALLVGCNSGSSPSSVPPPTPTFTLSYDGSGNTSGTAPTSETLANGEVTVVASGSGIARSGFTFDGWNTVSGGSGTAYMQGDSLTMGSADLTLYAQWEAAGPTTYSVSYLGNGNTGGVVPVDSAGYVTGATVTVLPEGSLVRSGYAFGGWNTVANGTGTAYAASATFAMGSANVNLHAQWTQLPSVILNAGDTQIAASWTSVGGAADYRVYFNTVDNVGTATLWNTTVGAITAQSATITGLTNGTPYFVWVSGMVGATETFVTNASATATPSGSIFSPQVGSIEPGENALEVALDKMVVVTFNQQLQGSSVNDTNVTVTAGGSPVAIVVALGSGGDAIEVTPQAGTWAQATMHTVTIGTGVTSASSASLASPYSFSFTTLDNAALRGRWVFNNSSVDVSGNGPAATVTGGTYDSVSLHEGTHSLALNSGSVVDLGTFNLGNQFSYTAWVNVTSTSSILTLFGNGVAGFSTDGIKVFVNEWGTSNRRIVIESGNGSAGKQIWTDPNFVTFGAWFHVAVTIDRTLGEAYLYFNGEQADTYDSGTSLASNLIRDDFGNNQQLYLNQFPGGNFHFVGNQDDVRFYNRVLTANEIRNIANEN